MQPFGPNLDGWYDVTDQLSTDIRERSRKNFERRAQEKAALKSVAEFEAYREGVKASFMEAIGGLPTEKTPLNPRVTGTIERNGFHIEKLIYESSPGYLVTALCYVPANRPGPVPAVISVHGHAELGKAYTEYQKVAVDLATNGFFVLAIDPIGQGERHQYIKDGESVTHACTIEHTYAGFPYLLQGASVARQFIWDVVRGIDYLETRSEVDASRIGITGNSGGGTQTSLLMMSEPRISAAVPCTFIMTLETMMKSGNPQDMEQIIHNSIVAGPDHDDFLTAMAPRPVLVGAVNYDAFPIEGSHEAVKRAKEVYALYGKPENVEIATDDAYHAYSKGLRQAAVNWFKKHLKEEEPNFITGVPEVLETEQTWVTKSGEVLLDYPDATTIFDRIQEHLASLPIPPRASVPELRERLADVLRIAQAGDRSAPIHPRPSKLHVIEHEGATLGTWEKVWFFSARDIAVSAILLHPEKTETDETEPREALPTTIVLLENGTNDVEAEAERLHALLAAGQRVLVFDVRGKGGVTPRVRNSGYEAAPFHGIFNSDYKLSCDAMMAGCSLLGMRVFDVLRAYDYLKTRNDVSSVSLHGVGSAASLAYFAAALEPGFAALTVEDMLFSYCDLCTTRFYDRTKFNLRIMTWGLLQAGDIVDFLPCLASRPVTFITPQKATGEALLKSEWDNKFITLASERGYLQQGWQPVLETQ